MREYSVKTSFWHKKYNLTGIKSMLQVDSLQLLCNNKLKS